MLVSFLLYGGLLSAQNSSFLHRGNIIHNGEAIFPVGYWTGDATVADKQKTLDALGPAGFDLLSYGVSPTKSDSLIDFFDQAAGYNVRFIFGLFGGDVAISDDISPLDDWVLKDLGRPIRNNPALLGYYHSDDVTDILSNELIKKDLAVKGVDPNHLTFHSTGVATPQDSLEAYAASADVPGIQIYPAGGNGLYPHNVHFHTQRMARAANLYGHSPMAVGNTHSLAEYFNDPTRGGWPTPEETDVYSYLSLVSGAKSLFFFTYGETGSVRIVNPGGLANYRPALWEKTKQIKNEIAELERVLLYGKRSTNEERTFTTYFGRWIYGDKVYVAAINSLIEGQPLPGTNTGVNAQTGRQSTAIDLPPGTRGPARPMFGKGNSLSVADGQLRGVLDILTVEFYELDYTAPIVANGGFEDGLAQWTSSPNAAVVNQGDRRVLRAAANTDASSVTTDITHRVLPGQTYTLSADLKGSQDSKVTVFVQLRDYRNQIITTEALEVNSADFATRSVTFTAPQEFGSAVVGVWRFPGGQGDAFIDNIRLAKGGAGSEQNITVRAQGDTGEERMALLIDGKTVREWNVTTTPTDYSVSAPIDGAIRVALTNDEVRNEGGVRIDRNLRVDYLSVDGQQLEAEDQVINTGSWNKANNRCGGVPSERINCPGYIEFGGFNQKTTSVSFGADGEPDFALYPNPTSGEVQLATELTDYRVTVFDVQGKLMLEQTKLSNNARLDISDLPKGLYLVRIQHEAGELTRKLRVN